MTCRGPALGRRHALRVLAAATASGVGVACAKPAPLPDRRLAIPLAKLPVGARMILVYDGEPAEILRSEGAIVARYMSCAHFGCAVAWSDAEQLYACACHGGRFDATGRPVAGPPLLPLRTIPIAIVGDQAYLGT